jgi:Tfp pilus assembly protein PilV
MRRSNFALRVPPTLLAEARKAAESEGVALNQLITLALAEQSLAEPGFLVVVSAPAKQVYHSNGRTKVSSSGEDARGEIG